MAGSYLVDDLRHLWRDWERQDYPAIEYPPGSNEGEVAGVDLALLDGDVAAVIHNAIDGKMTADDMVILKSCIAELERALPHLSVTGQSYFGPALAILQAIEARLGTSQS
jgi:hypothetical protein